jgi:hypothetical protein
MGRGRRTKAQGLGQPAQGAVRDLRAGIKKQRKLRRLPGAGDISS